MQAEDNIVRVISQRNRDALHNIALYKFPILFYSIVFHSMT